MHKSPNKLSLWIFLALGLIGCTSDDGPIVRADRSVDNLIVARASNARFAEAAAQAVSQWKFQPATVNGKAVACRMKVPIEFALNESQ